LPDTIGDGYEVDAVLDHASGEVVAIEVKAAETVRRDDVRGIQRALTRIEVGRTPCGRNPPIPATDGRLWCWGFNSRP